MSKLTQDKLNELLARTTRPNLSNAEWMWRQDSRIGHN